MSDWEVLGFVMTRQAMTSCTSLAYMHTRLHSVSDNSEKSFASTLLEVPV